VYGDKIEYPSHSKIDLLARVIAEQSLDRHTTWMVGDRIFDIEAAHANNLPCLFAGWGYGPPSEGELADAVAPTPADVRSLVGSPTGSNQHKA
jgi:phosphoglycolate phosphatase